MSIPLIFADAAAFAREGYRPEATGAEGQFSLDRTIATLSACPARPSAGGIRRTHLRLHRPVYMWTTLLILLYCVLVAGSSLGGGYLPYLIRLTHRRMQFIMSFVGGLMLGVALLHLFPHAIAETGSVDNSAMGAMAGLLTMFFLIRIFHVHQHAPAQPLARDLAAECAVAHDHDPVAHHHDHHDHIGHTHSHTAAHHAEGAASHRLSWIGLTIGLTLHTLVDGIALAASVTAEASHADGMQLWGLGTFLAVALHKPLDALSITSVMAAGGWSTRATQAISFAFAMMCPLGALAFHFGVAEAVEQEHVAVGIALAFAAGVFLCISLADLLPEVQFHTHDRVALSLLLLAGVACAYVMGFFEPEHVHGITPAHSHHGHAGHEH